MSIDEESLELHKKLNGKLKVVAKTNIESARDLSLLYTPGVAKACLEIAKNKEKAYELTIKGKNVAIVSDGTRVLGLGDIGPEAALPVMEGKAMIMQQFSGIDAYPVCLDTKDAEEIIKVVKAIAPNFGAINLEDIETPKVFYIEKRLTDELSIPVFHDDQHGTAIVVLAGIYNSLKLIGKNEKQVKIGIIGAGSAGFAIAKLLDSAGFSNLVVFDSKGAISKNRSDMEEYKKELAVLNKTNFSGKISEFIGADIIVSASAPGSLPKETVKSMNKNNVVFALTNPKSEFSAEEAKDLGIFIFGTGRSDYPNQVNNSLCFPGFLRALLELRVKKITNKMKIAAARAIADCVENPTPQKIVPEVFDKRIVPKIIEYVKREI
jgi:malate dehydrogenase (oxaloacetate-decarboxylating)